MTDAAVRLLENLKLLTDVIISHLCIPNLTFPCLFALADHGKLMVDGQF